jgi:Protein of unknown function (DUF3313)
MEKRISIPRGALIGAVLATVAAVATATPRVQTEPGAEVTDDGLHRVDGGTFARAWAKPGIDLAGYDKILLLPSQMSFREVKDPGLRRNATEFPLDEAQKERVRTTIHDAFVAELGKSKRFALTERPGPGVLEIRGAIVDVVSHVPDEPVGRGAIFVKSLGEATLVVELRDAETHELLARAVDRRAAESTFPARSNAVTNAADLRNAAQRWASLLRRRLDEFTVL